MLNFFRDKLLSYSAPTILWAVFIFIAMSFPMPPYEGNKITYYDKAVHFFMFGVLAWFLAQALYYQTIWSWRRVLVVSFFLVFAYTVVLEFWQLLIPGRDSSELDSLAGTLGAVVFLALVSLWPKRPRLLLHICCAGCGAWVAKVLRPKYAVVFYYYNPNIWPPQEYKKRLKEVRRIASIFNLPLIIGPYDHQKWLKLVAGHEQDPEGGERCRLCYQERLSLTAAEAKRQGFKIFTTTLTISPHKNAAVINALGRELANKLSLQFLDRDFKKKDGFKKSVELSRRLGLYRQNYCGCEFSRR